MSRTLRIVPAILSDDPKALETMVRQTETFTGYAQLDIMDGQFVPSRSVTSEHIAALKVKISWEAHLMVLHPEACVEDFRRAGAEGIVFHYSPASFFLLTFSKYFSAPSRKALAPPFSIADMKSRKSPCLSLRYERASLPA